VKLNAAVDYVSVSLSSIEKRPLIADYKYNFSE
jgi:hypothetical protein